MELDSLRVLTFKFLLSLGHQVFLLFSFFPHFGEGLFLLVDGVLLVLIDHISNFLLFVFNIIWVFMIVNQLIQLCAVNILLFCFSFSRKLVTFFIFCSSLSLEMLFLLFVLLNLHSLNLLNEYSLSLSVLNSFLSSFFFLG